MKKKKSTGKLKFGLSPDGIKTDNERVFQVWPRHLPQKAGTIKKIEGRGWYSVAVASTSRYNWIQTNHLSLAPIYTSEGGNNKKRTGSYSVAVASTSRYNWIQTPARDRRATPRGDSEHTPIHVKNSRTGQTEKQINDTITYTSGQKNKKRKAKTKKKRL